MKELLYFWMSTTLEVLVPKRRGTGFLRMPLGHHADHGMADIERAARCDIFGLDGSLSFQCGMAVATYAESRRAFEAAVVPALEKHYGWKAREVSGPEYWAQHPQKPR